MRVILVPLIGDADDALALQTAHRVGALFQSHIEGVFLRAKQEEVAAVAAHGLAPGTTQAIAEASQALWDARRETAKAAFEAARSAADAPLAEQPISSTSVTTRWREVVGTSTNLAVDHGRLADLIVVAHGRPDADPQRRQVLEAALFNAARPLLLADPTSAERAPQRIAIAWNGSAEATRAVAGALPLLSRAEAVHVFSARAGSAEARAAKRLVDYLGWHGVVVAERHAVSPDGSRELGASLLEQARRVDADLLVMGGYGHSRVREMIFGGVTRYVLDHAELPVLIAH